MEVVGWMGAIQAQDYAQAVWAVAVRSQGLTLADVEAEIAAGAILRTWPMRGTIHFVAAQDAKWMLQLGAARMLAADQRRLGQLALDVKTMERCAQLWREALQGGKRLTRPQMLQTLERAGISMTGQRGYHTLWYTAQAGVICIGPNEGKEQTFALLDEWAPNARMLPRDEAVAELTRRFFTSHGPATIHDLAWWSGLTITELRAGLEAAKPELTAEAHAGAVYWMSSGAASAAQTEPSTLLLPGFDEYLLGYRERGAVLDPSHAARVSPGANGVFRPMVVIDGQIVGTWRRALKAKSMTLSVDLFTQFDALPDRLAAAASRYGDFLGMHPTDLHTEIMSNRPT
jgi:hypothetical protein